MKTRSPTRLCVSRTLSRCARGPAGVLLTTLALALGLGVPSLALGEPTAAPSPARPEAAPVRGALPAGRSEESLAVKGIYLQKSTVLDGKRLQALIEEA